MDKPSTSGGLWNCPRPVAYSQETQELLKLLMQESHFANGQKRQIRECLRNGAPLHLACVSKPSSTPPSNSQLSSSRGLPRKSQKRSMEQCKAGGSYAREKFIPGPTRDLEKEKRHLQRILEMGKDMPTVTNDKSPSISEEAPQEKERFDEIMEEIEERQQFLDDMASLGQDQPYVSIINAEISQRIKELKLLDKPSNETSEGGTSV